MNKQQIILISAALALLAGLYFFGPTHKPKSASPQAAETHEHSFSMDEYLQKAVSGLSAERQQWMSALQASVKRGDVKDQSLHTYHQLAAFWRDSVPNPLVHYYFNYKAAELDNTEKSLTFAAHSILGYLPFVESHEEQHWLANKGKELFEKALALNPANDSSTVGMGGCIMYGAAANEEGGPMQGILKVREVAQRDSNNIFAQYMLGIGGMISRQYDKAILRFEKVVKAQPDNMEALFKLAETCEMMDNKAQAAEWYGKIATKVNNPEMKAELQKRIEQLKRP